LQQAARLAHWTAYFHLGELVEYGPSDALFHAPRDKRVQDFVTGKFG
jgi:phosphate transport system ATP-binding protein